MILPHIWHRLNRKSYCYLPATQSCFGSWFSHTLMTILLLLMPSKMQVLSTGTYCSVMTLMISCDTIPPVKAPMLWSSAPPARTLVVVSPSFRFQSYKNLHLRDELADLRLDVCKIFVTNFSVCFLDQIIYDLECDACELLCIRFLVGLAMDCRGAT